MTKVKAEAPAAGEPPSKARRSEDGPPESGPRDPMTIPERELQDGVQTLLATRVSDLANTTLGQLRSALEDHLGLDPGALSDRRRLRRRVSRVVGDEVAKRRLRGPECDRIVRALVEIEDCPNAVRQMLIDSLPSAVVKTVVAASGDLAPHVVVHEALADVGEVEPAAAAGDIASEGRGSGDPVLGPAPARALHPHQLRMLAILRDVLHDERTRLSGTEAAVVADLEAMEGTLGEHKAICSAATGADMAAQAAVAAAKARANDLQAEVTSARAQVEAAISQRSRAVVETEELQTRRSIALALREGPLTLLVDGGWTSEKDRESAVSAALAFLHEEGGDGALAAALPASLKKQPTARSTFDTLAVRSMVEFFEARIASMDARLRHGLEFAADAEQLAATAMLQATTERSADQMTKWGTAEAGAQAASEARRTAEALLAQQWSQTRELFGRLDSTRSRIQEVSEVASMVESWMAGGRTPGDEMPNPPMATPEDDGTVPPEGPTAEAAGQEGAAGQEQDDSCGSVLPEASQPDGQERVGEEVAGVDVGAAREADVEVAAVSEATPCKLRQHSPDRSRSPTRLRLAQAALLVGPVADKVAVALAAFGDAVPASSPRAAGRRASGAGLSPRGLPTPQRAVRAPQ